MRMSQPGKEMARGWLNNGPADTEEEEEDQEDGQLFISTKGWREGKREAEVT